MATPIPPRVLVYDRISQNRRKTIFLVTVAILSVGPFLGALGVGAYIGLGRLMAITQPLASDYQAPYARFQDYSTKLANAPPEKLAKLAPDYRRLSAARRKLF